MNSEYDVIVVGGGPAGSMAARFAAEKGVSVLLLEKDRDIGYPVRCGEAVSRESIVPFIDIDDRWVAAKIHKFSFYAPDGGVATLEAHMPSLVLERRIFDYELARTAAEAGAHIITRAYVNGLTFDNGTINGVTYEFQGEQISVRGKIVIAADGIESRVGRWAGLQTHSDFRDMESAVQVTAANIPVEQDTLHFYFGQKYAPHGYLWIFPKGNNKANIGLGISGDINKKKSALSYLNDFMLEKYPGAPILSKVSGGVPCQLSLDRISAPGIMLVGDAARHVNPLSGGGIATGMIGGQIAGSIAADAILLNKPEHILSYDKAWHNRIGKRHEIYNKLKEGIYNFSDDHFNNLAITINKVPADQRTLGRLFTAALFNQPSLLLEVAKVFVL